jgi:hypothetical protein
MAITTMDGLIAGLQPYGEDVIKAGFTPEQIGIYHSSWQIAGRPGAASAPSGGINGTALVAPQAGAIPIPATVAGKNIYLARFEFAHSGGLGSATLIDRLWSNSGLSPTTLTAQAITPVALPARDNTGTTNGVGVMAALEVTTASSNAGALTGITMSYTNEAGTAGRTAQMPSFPPTAVAGTWVPFTLAAGDLGVRSVQSVTFGQTLGAGATNLILYREIVSLGAPVANTNAAAGPIELGLPRVYDGSVLQLIYSCTNTTPGGSNAQCTFAQG